MAGVNVNMRKKAVIAGHICMDITPVFSKSTTESLRRLLEPGKLVQVGAADIHTGGAVANTGIAMKLMGIDVKLIGKIGADLFGKNVLSTFKRYNVQNDLIIDEHGSTSYSIVLAVPGTDRIFLHNPGVNDSFGNSDLDLSNLSDVQLFHFGYPPLMCKMYENGGDELVRMFRNIHDRGIITSLDFAAIDPESRAGKQDWKEILKKVLPYVDFFLPSMEELAFMVDRELYFDWQKRANGRDIAEIIEEEEICDLGNHLLDLGASNMLIKCGSKGFYYHMAGIEKFSSIENSLGRSLKEWYQKEGFEACYQPNCVLSGTGAGDTMIAAFLAAMLSDYSLEACLHLASAAGAACVENVDALGGVRSLENLMERICKGWKKCDL